MAIERAIAVIPARGGSDRIEDKNIRDFADKPMIAHSIQAAQEADLFERIIVSTDDEKIAEISKAYGADVPFRRPDSIADEHTPVSAATLDALKRVDPSGEKYEDVAQLFAVCPLRTAEDIKDSYRHFLEGDAVAQLSVSEYGWQSPWWAAEIDDEGTISPVFGEKINERSQDLPKLYCPTGAVWWMKTNALRQKRTFKIENRTAWEIPWQRGIDIDTMEELKLAELLFEMQCRSENLF